MGNSASSSGRAHHEETVDYGFLTPQGIYSGPRDWNHGIVTQLIIQRKLAPFYKPLEDYDESWDDEQILAARKEFLDRADEPVATSDSQSRTVDSVGSVRAASPRRPNSLKEPSRIPEAAVYRGAVECPICFLYYPPNINHSRCCDQAICTECFVQIKRSEPTATHLVSEPAACPYCVQDNFGVVYTPPQWRAGIGSDGAHSPISSIPSRAPPQQPVDAVNSREKNKRKSFNYDSVEVVTIDQIRPDWEAKLAAVRAAVARRANRRIIMRQVGDRLIPVGVTSGRVHAIPSDVPLAEAVEAAAAENAEGRSSRRSRRRQHQQNPQDLNHLFGSMGLGGQDLEELMVMEAMRLSLLEHDEQQRKEAAEKRKKEAEAGRGMANGEAEAGPSSGAASSRTDLPPIPVSSPIAISRREPSPASDGSSSASRSPKSISPLSGSPNSVGFASGRSLHSPNVPSPLGTAPISAPVLSVNTVDSLHSGATTPDGPITPRIQQNTDLPNPAPYSALSVTRSAQSSALPVSEVSEAPSGVKSPKESIEHITEGPTVTVSQSDSGAPLKTTLTPLVTSLNDPLAPSSSTRRSDTGNFSTNSFSSANEESSRSYDELPSSPESTISHRPLLLETPTAEYSEDGFAAAVAAATPSQAEA